MRGFALAALVATLSGCASVNYETTKPGVFRGEVAVVWIKGTDGPGDGTFVYVPTEGRPLTFKRPNGKTIEPGMIYTDGGSIPSFGRMFSQLTPWNYGPAYITHDWLFRARQCLNDDRTNPEYQKIAELTFQDSATIIAESIKALEASDRVKKSAISGAIVTAAVSSPISYRYWTAKGDCHEVSEADKQTALAAIGRKAVVGREGTILVLTGDKSVPKTRTGRVVAVVSYDD